MESVPSSGPAVFSTHLGKFAQRPVSNTPIVIRSSPESDQDSMIMKLRRKFPVQCKAIIMPVADIYQWFDPYDAHRHGYAFLHSVLQTIAIQNSNRVKQVLDFAEKWKENNFALFSALTPQSKDLFTEGEIGKYGYEFLAETYQRLLLLKSNLAVQYGTSKIPDMTEARRVVSYPIRSRPNYSRQRRTNSFGMNDPWPQINHPLTFHANAKGRAGRALHHGSDYHPPGHLLVPRCRTPVPHTPGGDFGSDPEIYTLLPNEASAIPSKGFPGPSQYHKMPLSARASNSRFGTSVMAHLAPHPPKLSSDDARVLEMQEAISRPGASDETMNTLFVAQRPLRFPLQVTPQLAEAQPCASRQEQAVSSWNDDPSILYACDKSGNGNPQSFYLQNQHQKQLQIRFEQCPKEVIQVQAPFNHWPLDQNSETPKDVDQHPANEHLAVGNCQLLQPHNESSPKIQEQRPYLLSQQIKTSTTLFTSPRHENSPFSSHAKRPAENGASGHYVSPIRNQPVEPFKIYMRPLPRDFSKPSIKELFGPLATSITDVTEVKLKTPNDLTGYAFVTFNTADEAAHALKTMDSTTPETLGGRKLLVDYATRRPPWKLNYNKTGAVVHNAASGIASNEGYAQEGAMTEEKHGESAASVGLNQIQLPGTSLVGRANNSAKLPNENTSPRKRTAQNPKFSHGRKTSSQQKRDAKPNAGKRKEDGEPMNSAGDKTHTPAIQPKPGKDSEEIVHHLERNIPNRLATSPVAATSVPNQSQTASSQKQARTRKKEPLAPGSELVEGGEALQGMSNDQPEPGLAGRGRRGSPPATQSVQNTASVAVAGQKSSEESECSNFHNKKEVLVSTITIAATQPLKPPQIPAAMHIVFRQQDAEAHGSEGDCTKERAAKVEAHVAGNENAIDFAISPSNNPTGEEEILVKQQESTSPTTSTSIQQKATDDSVLQLENSSAVKPHTKDEENKRPTTPPKSSGDTGGKETPGPASTTWAQIQTPKRSRPEIPLRTSSLLGSPPAPIVTHKKKQRIFTPVTEIFFESLASSAKDEVSESVDRTGAHQSAGDNQTGNRGEKNDQENRKEAVGAAHNAAPSPADHEGSHTREQRDNNKALSTAAASQPKKSRRKETAKKGKAKSKDGQVSSTISNLVDDGATGMEKRKANMNLPEPETPYLVDDQYMMPLVKPQGPKTADPSGREIFVLGQHVSAFFSSDKTNRQVIKKKAGYEAGLSDIMKPVLYSRPLAFTDQISPKPQDPTMQEENLEVKPDSTKFHDRITPKSSRLLSFIKGSNDLSDSSSDTIVGDEANEGSDLPFRQRYSNMDSSPSLITEFDPSASHIDFSLATAIEVSSSKDAIVANQMSQALTSPSQSAQGEMSVLDKDISIPGTMTRKANADLANPIHRSPIVDLTGEGSAPSTPTRIGHNGHQRVSASSSSLSSNKPVTPNLTGLPRFPIIPDVSTTFLSRGNADLKANHEIGMSQYLDSPPRTPEKRPFVSYAAAALPSTNNPPSYSGGEALQVASSQSGAQRTVLAEKALGDQPVPAMKDGKKWKKGKKGRGSQDVDTWSLPKGEKPWGIESSDRKES